MEELDSQLVSRDRTVQLIVNFPGAPLLTVTVLRFELTMVASLGFEMLQL